MEINKTSFWLGFFSMFMAVMQLVLLLGVIYINESGGDIVPLLRVDFYIFFISAPILLVYVIFRLLIKIVKESLVDNIELSFNEKSKNQ